MRQQLDRWAHQYYVQDAPEVPDAEYDRVFRALQALEDIPQGHKIALQAVGRGERIVRLGVPVAIATAPSAPGRLVHVHNVKSQYLDNDHDHFE